MESSSGPGRWGTWEELVLGGAVLRHGNAAWDAVAAELHARPRSSSPNSSSSFSFSPQECEAKFAEVQARYSGCVVWFEELRKQRVAELKRELEKSENSIGSLQSMIESLSNGRHNEDNSECDTSHTESSSPTKNTADTNSSTKELSKDRSSAASFTEEASKSWSPQVQNLATNSIQVNNTSAETFLNTEDETQGRSKESWLWGYRKKRGRRDRRMFVMGDESSRDGETTTSTACIEREGSSEGCIKGFKTPHVESGAAISESTEINLAEILKSISTQGDCSMLQRRLDVQRRRARYKKMIHRHMDFRILNSKIKNGAVSSAKELLRDVLLLVNNILAFYPKNTLEHMAATALRDLACKTVQQSSSSLSKSVANTGIASSPPGKTKKARTMQPGRRGPRGTKRSKVSSRDAGDTVAGNEGRDSHGDVPVAAGVPTNRRGAPVKKRGVGRPPKGGQKRGRARQESTNKGSKRSRR